MRASYAVLAIALLLAPLPAAAAGGLHTFEDARDDEALMGVTLLGSAGADPETDCASDAADITRFTVATTSTHLLLTLRMESLEMLDASCAHARSSLLADSASYGLLLRSAEEDAPRLELHAMAVSTGIGLDGCIALATEEGRSEECLGSFARLGDALVWTLPLAGTFETRVAAEHPLAPSRTEERTYDLRGEAVMPSASARVTADELGLVSIRDAASGARLVL